jgi:predicted nucleic acid-binding protein
VIVVSNTSPLTNLAAVGLLDLLRQLYEKVFIPQAVYDELTGGSGGQPGATEVQTLEWIETMPVMDHALVVALQMELDEGEAEAIVLTKELAADLVLLDERRGRVVASRLGLRFVGLLGVLIEAKQKGSIPAVKAVLDDLVAKAGFWVSQQLYARVLQAAGE